MTRFLGVYIEDKHFAAGLSLIRFLTEPNDIRWSHITLRGPYTNVPSDVQLSDLRQKVHKWVVRIEEPGRFFSKSQATVFLTVYLGELGKLWYKPDFPDGVPHITLYDGVDHELACKLYDIISLHDWNTKLSVSKLKVIDFKAPTDLMSVVLLREFVEYFEAFTGCNDPLSVGTMSAPDRLLLCQRVILKLGRPIAEQNRRRRAERAKSALRHVPEG